MTRFIQPSNRERFAIWIRQYILGINIINSVGGILNQNQQGFVGVFLILTGLLGILNAFNKKLNVTFLDKGHAMLSFIVGTITTYIGGVLIYTNLFGG